MHAVRSIFIILWACLTFSVSVFAQDTTRLSMHLEKATVEQFVHELEIKSAYHFYFDVQKWDSLRISVSVTNSSLSNLLDQALEHTSLKYAITSDGRVFLTSGVAIQTSLPTNFFDDSTRVISENRSAARDIYAPINQSGLKRLQVSDKNKIYEFGVREKDNTGGTASVTGYIREEKSGEAVSGAVIRIDSGTNSVTTDDFGFYNITLKKGSHVLIIHQPGMREVVRQIALYANGNLNIDLPEYIASLRSVLVTADKTSNTKSVTMGVDKLNIKTIKQIPSIFGESDILKVLLTLPGVTSVGEASNGFNVRGGAADQNLILFNDATIYNPSHLFGFFSAFNPDVVKGIELYKNAIPEKYGGRLASVLDVSQREGSSKNWTGSAGIGPLTGKFYIEGPLKKEKTSLIAAFRTTYSDWILHNISNKTYAQSNADFYDGNFHINHIIDRKNTLSATVYFSNDHFNLNNDTTYQYRNKNANVKWKHVFNNKFYGIFTGGLDHYQYSVSGRDNPVNSFALKYSINQSYFRADFVYTANPKHTIDFGLNTIYYKIFPGTYQPTDSQSLTKVQIVPKETGLETALYLGDHYTVNSKLTIDAGIRFSIFNYLGPHDVYEYGAGKPRDVAVITDTTSYGNNKFIKTYAAPEIRLSARYSLNDKSSVKLSFNTTQQYIHTLSNTISISPTDIFKLSDPYIKPQQGRQLSAGYYRNFNDNRIEFSVELYYKQIRHYLDYKSGANLILNTHIETDVFNTRGKAYGIEFLLKKSEGKLNGWISYTYSRTLLQQDDPIAGETINQGKYYPANFDKPHNANFIGNYRFSHRLSLSLNVVYSTGRPITLPLSVFQLGGSSGLYYSNRNQYRIPDYFRTDISLNLEGNHHLKKTSHNFWSFGIYNLTGRKNPYSVYFTQEGGQIKGYELSIFGTLIPFVTYNIKF